MSARQALKLVDASIPGFGTALSAAEASNLDARMKEWDDSDFAGYRNMLKVGDASHPNLAAIESLARERKTGATGKAIRHFVLFGTGGSSLGPETLIRALRSAHEAPFFHFMDNNDPEWFSWLLRSLNPEETLVYVVSKSGKTPETLSQFLVCLEWMKKGVANGWQKHFVLCTDPAKGDLRQLAQRWELACLDVPPPVGGRFSVLTPVGLFPAAFAGLSLSELLDGARSVANLAPGRWDANPCAQLAAALVRGLRERPITVLMPYSTRLQAYSRWFCQLWAESLGKGGRGFTPYPAIGTTDQHSQVQLYMEGPRDKVIVLLRLREQSESLPLSIPEGPAGLPSFEELRGKSMRDLFDAEFRATRDAFTQNGVANCTIEVDRLDAYSLGALFYFWEWTTGIAGALMGVNPFDQPGVEAAKILTKKYLGEVRG